MRRYTIFLLLAATFTGCAANSNAELGTGIGAVTGALAGAAIGKNSGNTATGAVLGAGVGALAGSSIGRAVDEDQKRTRMIERRIGRRLAGAVSIQDTIYMSNAGLEDDIIVSQIRANGVASRPTPQDLVTLKENQVSAKVIKALQETPHPVERIQSTRPVSRPVIVEEHYYSPQPVFVPMGRPVRHYYHRPPRRRRSRTSLHVRF